MDLYAGLTNESRAILEAYLQWGRLRLEKFSRDLSYETQAYADGNLLQASYSPGDVTQVLRGQVSMINASLEKQLAFVNHASAALMRAVLYEADRHRIPLEVNAPEVLGNTGAQTAVEQHEQRLVGGPRGKLAPLSAVDMGGEAGRQLAEANDEIRRLNDKVRKMTDQLTSVMNEKSGLVSEIHGLKDQLVKTNQALELSADSGNAGGGDSAGVIQQLRAEVAAANKELVMRVNQTTQFTQLKTLLAKRNDQVKELRAALSRYDPLYGQEATDD